jgi:replicative DNA helicase
MTGRVPPNNQAAERSLLSAMLLSKDAIATAVEELPGAEAFYNPGHGHTYDAITNLWAQGQPADVVTVADHLTRAGVIDQVGGPAGLIDIQTATPSIGNAPAYAKIITDAYVLRQVIGAAAEITEIGYTSDDADTAVDRAEQHLFRIGDQRRRRSAQHFGSGVDSWLDRLAEMRDTGRAPGVSSGIYDLDELLLGFQAGQLITICGRPGMGKSQVAAQLARNAAGLGHPTLLVSLEMSRDEIDNRMMAAEALVPLQAIRSGHVSQNDWARLGKILDRVRSLPLWIDDDASHNLMTIRASARRVASRAGGLDLIVVDYMQLVEALGKHNNREGAVAEVSRGLKKLALELGCPVIGLAQLNRGVESRMDKRPMLSDLRESGAIENDSDVVLALYRDEYYRNDSPDKGIIEILALKQRSGPTGTVKAAYLDQYGSIRNMARVS